MKSEDDDISDDSQSDSSSVISEGELRIAVSPTTPQSPGKSVKPKADKSDDFYEQKVKEKDYSSIIESIKSNPSDSKTNNSIVPEYASSGNRLSLNNDRDNGSNSVRSTAYLEVRSAPALQIGTPAKVVFLCDQH